MSSCCRSRRSGRRGGTGRQGNLSFRAVVSIIDHLLLGNRWSNRNQMSIRNASGINNVLLCQRKWNYDEQKNIKRPSDKLGLSGPLILSFHKSAFARGENLFSSGRIYMSRGFFMTYSFYGIVGRGFWLVYA